MHNDPESIAAALGRIPSGCAICTAASDRRATGMLVSWFQQAGFDPPHVTVALRRERPISALIHASGKLVLNLVGERESKAMFAQFGRGFGLDDDAFSGLTVSTSEFGPVLESAIAALGCAVRSVHTAGDHEVYIAEVIAARGDASHAPYVHLRRNGLSY